jgi:cob(I)alamin adenosyltransferase
MTKKYKIYTRTGDDGSTGLIGGSRVKKNSLRVVACGEIDTMNSYIGLVRSHLKSVAVTIIDEMLEQIQHELFNVGAEVATPVTQRTDKVNPILKKQHLRLEAWIDLLDDSLPALRSFILPAGNTLVSLIHISRAHCRAAERAVVSLADRERVSKDILVYLNRLSDLLFVMARYTGLVLEVNEVCWDQEKMRRPIAPRTINSSHQKKASRKQSAS